MSFKCEVCDKVFKERKYLIIHFRIHSGEKPFSCNICGRKFTQRGHLRSHFRRHTGDLPFKCTVCNKAFGENSNLVRHERIHSGEKPYSCGVCGKLFGEQSGVNNHVKIHSGERPHNCALCDKAFILKHHLVVHLRTIHNVKPNEVEAAKAALPAMKTPAVSKQNKTEGNEPKVNSSDPVTKNESHPTSKLKGNTPELSKYPCGVCGTELSNKTLLVSHLKTHITD